MGMERRRMRRRPMRSMSRRARRVKVKFVRAMERAGVVGEEKPIREKMVAEKYIREFWKGGRGQRGVFKLVVWRKENSQEETYKTAELLQALEEACDC